MDSFVNSGFPLAAGEVRGGVWRGFGKPVGLGCCPPLGVPEGPSRWAAGRSFRRSFRRCAGPFCSRRVVRERRIGPAWVLVEVSGWSLLAAGAGWTVSVLVRPEAWVYVRGEAGRGVLPTIQKRPPVVLVSLLWSVLGAPVS